MTKGLAALGPGLLPAFTLASLISSPASASLTVSVRDALTGESCSGLVVMCGAVACTTGSSGCRLEVTPDCVLEVISPDGSYFPTRTGLRGESLEIHILVIPNVEVSTSHYPDFLTLFRALSGTRGVHELAQTDLTFSYEHQYGGTLLRRWQTIPLEVKVEEVQNEWFSELVQRSLGEWETETGLDLFTLVYSGPASPQVSIRLGGDHSRVVFDQVDATGLPAHTSVFIQEGLEDPEQRRAHMLHELGHVLMILSHSEDPRHLMYGRGAPTTGITKDEAMVVRVIYYLPPLTNVEQFGEDPERKPHRLASDLWVCARLIIAAYVLFLTAMIVW